MRSSQDSPTPFRSVSSRGTIIAIHSDEPSAIGKIISWAIPADARTVDVVCTSEASPAPRFYKNVAWNSVNAPADLKQPFIGDGVQIGFVGGSSEFPYVVSHYPGSESLQASSQAVAPRTAAPAVAQELGRSAVPPASQGVFGLGLDFLGSLLK